MEEFNEKRMYQRFNRHCSGRVMKDDEEIAIYINNMSGQGLGFRTKTNLPVKERLSIHLDIEGEKKPLIVTGEVIWSNLIDGSIYDIGFRLDMASWMKMSEILA